MKNQDSADQSSAPVGDVSDQGAGGDNDGSVTTAGNSEAGDVSRETFPAAYVKQLRKENAGYRERAGRADELEEKSVAMATRLHAALVARDGRLSNPEDLPFDPAHIEDEALLTQAITDLIRTRPGLRARAAAGDIGHGNRGAANVQPVSLIDMIKGAR